MPAVADAHTVGATQATMPALHLEEKESNIAISSEEVADQFDEQAGAASDGGEGSDVEEDESEDEVYDEDKEENAGDGNGWGNDSEGNADAENKSEDEDDTYQPGCTTGNCADGWLPSIADLQNVATDYTIPTSVPHQPVCPTSSVLPS